MSENLKWNDLMLLNYETPNINFVEGHGAYLIDDAGNSYLDFLGGIATNLLGHGHSAVVQAISRQAATMSHTSNLYSHSVGLRLAKKLTDITGGGRVFFCNSGAEANEAALKISRLTGKGRVITTEGSFHGRTMGALSLTGQATKRAPFEPLVPGVTHVPFGDASAIAAEISRGDVAMVLVESIQGEAGVIIPPVGYLRELREMTSATGVLLACDEVQSGMGRTGDWFGYQSDSITPDIVTMAKGLGGGLPLGALIAVTSSAQLFTPGSHGSTFGGNPIACAAALATFDVIEREDFLTSNRSFGLRILEAINGSDPAIVTVRGRGLWIGFDLVGLSASDLTQAMSRRGVLVNASGPQTIRIAPPYVITESDISKFLDVLKQSLHAVKRDDS